MRNDLELCSVLGRDIFFFVREVGLVAHFRVDASSRGIAMRSANVARVFLSVVLLRCETAWRSW